MAGNGSYSVAALHRAIILPAYVYVCVCCNSPVKLTTPISSPRQSLTHHTSTYRLMSSSEDPVTWPWRSHDYCLWAPCTGGFHKGACLCACLETSHWSPLLFVLWQLICNYKLGVGKCFCIGLLVFYYYYFFIEGKALQVNKGR